MHGPSRHIPFHTIDTYSGKQVGSSSIRVQPLISPGPLNFSYNLNRI